MKILRGAEVAAAIDEKTSALAARLREEGVSPCLATVRVGERPDDISYERGASKRCEKLGIGVRRVCLPEGVAQEELEASVRALAEDGSVHGILLLRPLPGSLDEEPLRRLIPPEKDVDGLTDGSLAGVFSGSGTGFAPCTAESCAAILEHYGIEVAGRSVCVLGRSLVVGRPLAMLLMQRDATVTVCHSKTKNSAEYARSSDILIAAVGRARSVGREYFHGEQTVIDVGVHAAEDGKLCGDVDFDAAAECAGALTPVPGGVGAVTSSVLAAHTAQAAAGLCGKGADKNAH